jgi:hypothetical protein
MRMQRLTLAILALVMAPFALHATDLAKPNTKLPEAMVAAPLLPKQPAPESRLSHACALGQAGGVALGLMLGSGRAWDALTDAMLGQPPNTQQQAFCTLGEALAPHVIATAEGLAQEARTLAQRQAETAKDVMAAGNAQAHQAWAALRDGIMEKSAHASNEVTRLCEGSGSCVWLNETASSWARFWPMR